MSCAQRDSNGNHTNPKRKRGFCERSPRLRFGLVWPVSHPSVNRSSEQNCDVEAESEERTPLPEIASLEEGVSMIKGNPESHDTYSIVHEWGSSAKSGTSAARSSGMDTVAVSQTRSKST